MMDEGTGLVFNNLTFYQVDLNSGNSNLVARLPADKKKSLLGKFRLLNRLMRMEPRCAGRLDNGRFVVNVLGKVWLLDCNERTVQELIQLRPGYSILNFCEKDGGLYWGDYGRNNGLKEIRIYKVGDDRQVKVIYTFEAGTVRHIHNIIKDGN